LDVLLARVGGEQGLVAPALFLGNGRVLLAARVLGFLLRALVAGGGGRLRFDAPDHRALLAQLLHDHANALRRDALAVVFLAVLAYAAVGLRLGGERCERDYGGKHDVVQSHRIPPQPMRVLPIVTAKIRAPCTPQTRPSSPRPPPGCCWK